MTSIAWWSSSPEYFALPHSEDQDMYTFAMHQVQFNLFRTSSALSEPNLEWDRIREEYFS